MERPADGICVPRDRLRHPRLVPVRTCTAIEPFLCSDRQKTTRVRLTIRADRRTGEDGVSGATVAPQSSPRGVHKLGREARCGAGDRLGGRVASALPSPEAACARVVRLRRRLPAVRARLVARAQRPLEGTRAPRFCATSCRSCGGRRGVSQLTESDRLVLAALSRVMPRRSWQTFLVTPETLLRWHRRIVARRWTYPHRRPGRPPVDPAVRQLILRLARENSHWGYVRIVGELRKLGITVSATLVRNVLARAGIPPAPERAASSWRSFLRQHGNTILACDLFTVDTVWLRRLYVLFFVSIGTRRVEYVACTSKPDTSWMTQQARNLLMDLDDRGQRPRFLIHDRDTKFSRAFDSIFRSEGIEIVRTPIRGAKRELPRRTLGRQRAQGVPRPAPDLWPPPARARPARLHPPLQPAASTPSTRSATAGSQQRNRSSAHSDSSSAAGPAARPPGRPAPRIRSRRVKD